MQTYNALTFNDLFGLSPRSHFVTADGRDLDLRYVMLKNLPEKLKAMGVLFSAGSTVTIDADGYIYYAEGMEITDKLSNQVLVTKKYVDGLLKGEWEKKGAVKEHLQNMPHLKIGFVKAGSFEINLSPEQCIQEYNSRPENQLLAASLFHHHNELYALKGHSHNYDSLIKSRIEELLSQWGSIEVYPFTLVRRDENGILKGTDPFSIYPEDKDVDDGNPTVAKKGPEMDMLVNVFSLRKRLQPRFIRTVISEVEDETVYPPSRNGISRDEIKNLKELIEYLHPGLTLADVDDEIRVTWGCTNWNNTTLISYANDNATAECRNFFTKESDKVHSSIVKFDGSKIAIPVMDFNRDNVIDPPTLNPETGLTESVEGMTGDGFYFWICIPETAFISDTPEFFLKNIENSIEDVVGPDKFVVSDNWSTLGFTNINDAVAVENNVAVFRKDGIRYLLFSSNYFYSGQLYRFMLSRNDSVSFN